MGQTLTQRPVDVLSELLKPATLADPYPFLAWVRDNDPVHRTPTGTYLVTRSADCREVLSDTTVFRGPEPDEIRRVFPDADRHRSQRILLESIAYRGPSDHARLRRLVCRDFTVRRVEALRPRMEKVADALLDAVADRYLAGGTVDLHETVAARFPLCVFGELLGIPEQDRAELARSMSTVLVAMQPTASAQQLDAADAANRAVEDYFTDLAELRRGAPRDDLVSALGARHDDDPDQLTHDELITMLWALWAGGVATTAAAIDHGILTMIRYPDATAWLRGGPDRARAFVDEVLRHEAPAILAMISRHTARDVELSGVTIPAGSDLRVVFPAANRDPAAFEAPDRFDPGRADLHRTHVSFGHGVHYCLGAALSRQELGVILPKIHSRLPRLALARPPSYRPSLSVRALEHLDVVLDRD
jgi:cytochrome P450 family 114